MNRRITILCIVSFFVVMTVIGVISNPLMRTQSTIHRRLLHLTPIGTSMEEVISIAEDNPDWVISRIREEGGILQSLVWSAYSYSSPPFPDVIGEQYIRIHLGTYHAITRVDVVAHYVFDASGKLIDIFVRRSFDVL